MKKTLTVLPYFNRSFSPKPPDTDNGTHFTKKSMFLHS